MFLPAQSSQSNQERVEPRIQSSQSNPTNPIQSSQWGKWVNILVCNVKIFLCFKPPKFLKNKPTMCSYKLGVVKECRVRIKQRRPVTLPWIMKVVKSKIENLSDSGWICSVKGKPLEGSRTWCWYWLVQEGFLSRASGNKRKNSPEDIRKSMKKWLHFAREKVLYNKEDKDVGGDDTGGTREALVDEDPDTEEPTLDRHSALMF